MIRSWGVEVYTKIHMIAPEEHIISSSLTYQPEYDPYAVIVILDRDHPEPVNWVFARDLLAAGLEEPTGIGDVRVRPLRNAIIELATSSPDGEATYYIRRTHVTNFLRQSYAFIPRGHEKLDLDDELLVLLNECG